MPIRKATLEDISEIARVHVDTSQATYTGIIPDQSLANQSYAKRQSIWERIIMEATENNNFIYVAENKSKQVVGFAHGGLERENNPLYLGELYAIYILPNYQQKGFGRTLRQATLNKLNGMGINSMLVWVLADNSACQFYEALKGIKISNKKIERGGKILTAVAYGWLSTTSMIDE